MGHDASKRDCLCVSRPTCKYSLHLHEENEPSLSGQLSEVKLGCIWNQILPYCKVCEIHKPKEHYVRIHSVWYLDAISEILMCTYSTIPWDSRRWFVSDSEIKQQTPIDKWYTVSPNFIHSIHISKYCIFYPYAISEVLLYNNACLPFWIGILLITFFIPDGSHH